MEKFNFVKKRQKYFLALIALLTVLLFPLSEQEESTSVLGWSSVSGLQNTYDKWSASYAKTQPPGPVLTMLWTRGLSAEKSAAKGFAQLDLKNNKVSVRVKGLLKKEFSEVWLVDNVKGDGRSVLPEEGDTLQMIGRLTFEENGDAWLDAFVNNLADFQLDMMVIARQGGEPGRDGVLYGTTTLFQKVFHYPGYKTSSADKIVQNSLLINSARATGITPDNFFPGLDSALINEGRNLFFEETFNGNGRSCGTCHREDDNMALSLKTIAGLPDDDPLFIVEQEFRQDGSVNPLFEDFRMEKPALMRKAGLIVENLNGFKDPDGEFTENVNMRAPSHVLSVRTTLAPPPASFDDGTLPVHADDLVFAERTGWSGDGTPTGFREDFFESNDRELTGSLRDFVVGAVVQHYPLTLERSAFSEDEGGLPRTPDFRFPTEDELDAIEAFMLSIGRQEENDDLTTIALHDELADRGRMNYMGFNVFDAAPDDGRPPLNCNACHFNGGSNTDPSFPFPPSVTPNHDLADLMENGGTIPSHNRSFGPQVERLIDQAGDVLVGTVDDPSVASDGNPFDNGFAFGFNDGFAGERIATNRFNAPVVFEAADNSPFFHGHQISTIEGAVAFYATNRHLRNGEFLEAIVPLNGAQVVNVSRFIRVMGADFNITSAVQLLEKSLGLNRPDDRRHNIRLALAETVDAVELLDPVDLHIQDAVPLLIKSKELLTKSALMGKNDKGAIGAIMLLREAQLAMVAR